MNRFDLTEIFVKLIFAFCFLAIFVGICFGVVNESNRISEGVVIDKIYTAAYTSYTYAHHSRGATPIPTYHAATYSIKLQGEKDGEIVTHWKNVTEREYHGVDVGDYYPQKGE